MIQRWRCSSLAGRLSGNASVLEVWLEREGSVGRRAEGPKSTRGCSKRDVLAVSVKSWNAQPPSPESAPTPPMIASFASPAHARQSPMNTMTEAQTTKKCFRLIGLTSCSSSTIESYLGPFSLDSWLSGSADSSASGSFFSSAIAAMTCT